MPDIALSPTQRATEPTAATEAARLEPGTRAGEYVVESFLGAGAMGEVYAGKHPDIGKRVAIKVLKPALASSKEAAERFKREARVVNQIDHPNVIDVFAFGELADGRLYLVMDLVEGRTLREAVQDGPLAIETALDILDQIAEALDAAHAKGVVHRDLKPDNVMLAGSRTVHVLDFGIAKLLATDATKPATMLTGQGAWIGTPGYMAPEQWSAEGASPASDRYALGVMAFELLAGKLPFQAATLPQMMEQHFRAPVPALSTRGAVPARATFDPVLARAMAKDPDKRFATAKALVTALREAAGKRRVLPVRTWWVPAAVGAGVLGIAVVGVIAVRGGPEREAANPSAATGILQVEVRSNPQRATVMRGDRTFGTTPVKLDVRAGERVELTVRKAGYATAALAASADKPVVDVVLVQINGFEGTWVLPDGQLRAFARSGDEHVDVYKLESLKSERVFYRKFKLEDAPNGVRFSSTELVIDQRAPSSPSCEIAVRVEYHYDPARDALAVRPENVETGFQNGRCVIHGRELAAPVALVRADATASDVRISRAPMGIPIDEPSLRPRPEPQDEKLRALEQQKQRRANPPPRKQPPAKVQTKVPPGKVPPAKRPPAKGKGDIGAQNADIAPNDVGAQAPPPQPVPQAQQVKK